MVMLKKTYVVEGLNQKILLDRLIYSKINLLKVKKITQKCLEITIDSKDDLKFFAICKNMWYNKLIKVGGILSPFYLMVKNPLKIVCLLLSLFIIFFGENVYLESSYKGDAIAYRSAIESAFEQAEIKRYSFFSEGKLERVRQILNEQYSFGYLQIQKRGNKAVIEIRALKSEPQRLVGLKSDLIALENLKILNATVYSGTLLKSVGESVSKGEVIAGAYYFIGDSKIDCELLAVITAECTYTYEYKANTKITNDTLLNAIASAKLMLGDYEVISSEYKITDGNLITVTLKYEKLICGG